MIIANLRTRVTTNGWADDYWQHPIVATSAERVLPVALYCEGIEFAKRDGVLGFFATNLITEKRHLIGVFRRSSMCRCGCRYWCSLHTFWSFVRWCCDAVARGKYPDARHDKKDWSAGDAIRESVVGESLDFRGAVIRIGWSTPRHWVCRHGPATLLPAKRAIVRLGIGSILLPGIFHRCHGLSLRTKTTTRLVESAKSPLS